mmetsp:Transcript_7182/g.18565  ORF Transcript_7182/g.18565 Transcript_7182/m.18565 type:complete len:265 (+) Transcript_7182:1482-2276(+)
MVAGGVPGASSPPSGSMASARIAAAPPSVTLNKKPDCRCASSAAAEPAEGKETVPMMSASSKDSLREARSGASRSGSSLDAVRLGIRLRLRRRGDSRDSSADTCCMLQMRSSMSPAMGKLSASTRLSPGGSQSTSLRLPVGPVVGVSAISSPCTNTTHPEACLGLKGASVGVPGTADGVGTADGSLLAEEPRSPPPPPLAYGWKKPTIFFWRGGSSARSTLQNSASRPAATPNTAATPRVPASHAGSTRLVPMITASVKARGLR